MTARIRCERGSGSILVVAIMAGVLGMVALVSPLWVVLVARSHLAAAADSSALAAADVAVGRTPGQPCDSAAMVARANDATLLACEADGLIVTVLAEGRVLGFSLVAAATAGPASSAHPG